MKLVGSISAGSGAINEDAVGCCERDGSVFAAWVMDGVTGINSTYMLDVRSEAAWFVGQVQRLLEEIVPKASGVLEVLQQLVPLIEVEWHKALGGKPVPAGYDLPAACLTLAMCISGKWQALRLGDSYILSKGTVLINHAFPPSELPDLEAELRKQAAKLRSHGAHDFNALREAFREQLTSSRKRRNQPGSYSILVPDQASLAMPQVLDLGAPREMLLCTDGYYRAVESYGLFSGEGLLQASAQAGGVEQVYDAIRATEAADPDCLKFARFKPSDDVSAVMLRSDPMEYMPIASG